MPILRFIDVPTVFDGDIVTVEGDRYRYGEQRFVTFGLLQGRVRALRVNKIPVLVWRGEAAPN